MGASVLLLIELVHSLVGLGELVERLVIPDAVDSDHIGLLEVRVVVVAEVDLLRKVHVVLSLQRLEELAVPLSPPEVGADQQPLEAVESLAPQHIGEELL